VEAEAIARGHAATFAEREQLTPVTSIADAQLYVPFSIRVPSGLGSPTMTAATPRDAVGSPARAAVVFRYEDPHLGRLTVMEQGGDDVVTIRGGIPAHVLSNPSGVMVRWIENGVAFTVIGTSHSREEVLAAVEKV
jgi:hypothetical protein